MIAPNPRDWTSSIAARPRMSAKVALLGVPVVPVSAAAAAVPVELDGLAAGETLVEAEVDVAVGVAEAIAMAVLARADALGLPAAARLETADGEGEETSCPVELEKCVEFRATTITRTTVEIKAASRPASQVARGARKPAIIGGRSGTG
jgi:hypothetical protein